MFLALLNKPTDTEVTGPPPLISCSRLTSYERLAPSSASGLVKLVLGNFTYESEQTPAVQHSNFN